MTDRPVRVLVVDDAVVVRRLVADVLARDPLIDVVGTAANGHIALEKVERLTPDLITLDLEMPEMDGLETLQRLRRSHPHVPVIMFSTLTERGAAATLDALALGARDYVTKPAASSGVGAALEHIRTELIPKVRALGGKAQPAPSRAPVARARRFRGSGGTPTKVIAIGVSTGGPNALAELLPHLPADLPVPVLIVQHMPPLFTKLLAQRLDAVSSLSVAEATHAAEVRPGTAWIAPGGRHMAVRRVGDAVYIALRDDPPEHSCRPSVNVLFRSVADTYGPGALGVMLTGMGQDGIEGSQEIHERGGDLLAQDEATSVVWGMPGFVVRAGLATAVVPLPHMASAILSRIAAHAAMPPTVS